MLQTLPISILLACLLRNLCWLCRNMINPLRWGAVITSPNPTAVEPPLVGCPRMHTYYIRSYPPYLEDIPPSAPWGRACCGERDPLISVTGTHLSLRQGPPYHCDGGPLITMTGAHLSLWGDSLITGTVAYLSLCQVPTCHCNSGPIITVTGTHLSL
jgi:hypothetical protein